MSLGEAGEVRVKLVLDTAEADQKLLSFLNKKGEINVGGGGTTRTGARVDPRASSGGSPAGMGAGLLGQSIAGSVDARANAASSSNPWTTAIPGTRPAWSWQYGGTNPWTSAVNMAAPGAQQAVNPWTTAAIARGGVNPWTTGIGAAGGGGSPVNPWTTATGGAGGVNPWGTAAGATQFAQLPPPIPPGRAAPTIYSGPGPARPRAGMMGQNLFGTGMYMNVLFGGIEVAKALNANSRLTSQEAMYSLQPEAQLAASQQAIQSISGGFMGSIGYALASTASTTNTGITGSLARQIPGMGYVGRQFGQMEWAVQQAEKARSRAEQMTAAGEVSGLRRFGSAAMQERSLDRAAQAVGLDSFDLHRKQLEIGAGDREDFLVGVSNTIRGMNLGRMGDQFIRGVDAMRSANTSRWAKATADVNRRESQAMGGVEARTTAIRLGGMGFDYLSERANVAASYQDAINSASANMKPGLAAQREAALRALGGNAYRANLSAAILNEGNTEANRILMGGGRPVDATLAGMRAENEVNIRNAARGIFEPGGLRRFGSVVGSAMSSYAMARFQGESAYSSALMGMDADIQYNRTAAGGAPLFAGAGRIGDLTRAKLEGVLDPKIRGRIMQGGISELMMMRGGIEKMYNQAGGMEIEAGRTDLTGTETRRSEDLGKVLAKIQAVIDAITALDTSARAQ